MNPCKKCLVRASCREDCKSFEIYRYLSTELMTILSIFISAIWLIVIFYFAGCFDEKNMTDSHRWLMVGIWLVTAVSNLYMNCNTKEKFDDIVVIVFAPYVFLTFIHMYLLGYFFTKNIRKRV